MRLRPLFLMFFLLIAPCLQAAQPSPQEWLDVRGKELLKVLSEKNTKQRFAKTLRLADNVFNSKELSRLALGRFWIEFSDEQKAKYSDIFLKYFVVTYASSPLPLDSVSFKIGKSVPSGKDILVRTTGAWNTEENALLKDMQAEAPQNSGKTGIDLVFALRKTNDGYYIRDFQMEGKSVLLFLRGKMEKEYTSCEYSPDKMIEEMQKKIKTAVANADTMDKMRAQRTKPKTKAIKTQK